MKGPDLRLDMSHPNIVFHFDINGTIVFGGGHEPLDIERVFARNCYGTVQSDVWTPNKDPFEVCGVTYSEFCKAQNISKTSIFDLMKDDPLFEAARKEVQNVYETYKDGDFRIKLFTSFKKVVELCKSPSNRFVFRTFGADGLHVTSELRKMGYENISHFYMRDGHLFRLPDVDWNMPFEEYTQFLNNLQNICSEKDNVRDHHKPCKCESLLNLLTAEDSGNVSLIHDHWEKWENSGRRKEWGKPFVRTNNAHQIFFDDIDCVKQISLPEHTETLFESIRVNTISAMIDENYYINMIDSLLQTVGLCLCCKF